MEGVKYSDLLLVFICCSFGIVLVMVRDVQTTRGMNCFFVFGGT